MDLAPTPSRLQQLLTRMEMADRLAAGGYELTTAELAQLVEIPHMELSQHRQPWI
ncbi:hypothetical protein [Candidatus Synechococcus spongiarum]|uniref:Ribonuclease HI n=1 Tax=Candidatus Synechococcus spongiarum TaxID=431041 RepID=A0A171DGV7_9SYNE|nr:Ribonuclease HI [Candidatus Synechococcus spongiarum]